jgi:hypothetical protein
MGMTLPPAKLMETYLSEVVLGGRLELIEQIAREDMVDEANQAFGGPRDVMAWWRTSRASGATSASSS